MQPAVSIIVPARNEERSIGRCVDSLLAQERVEFELIVVDDQSTDRTAELLHTRMARESRLRLLQISALPPGWTGKNYALTQGITQATGAWVLFTDADTWHAPNSLHTLLAFALRNGIDLLSVTPDQECIGFWENLIQPAIFEAITQRYSYHRINDQRDDQAACNGQYLLIRRAFYDAIGGHTCVKGCILEDVELAKRAKRAGGTLWFGPARGKVRARMYHCFSEIWQGWTKNLYLLQDARLSSLARMTLRIIAIDVVPSTVVLTGAWIGATGWLLVAAGGLWVFRWGHLQRRWGRLGFRSRYAILYPISAIILLCILWYSAYVHRRGRGVAWKDRICINEST